MKKRPRIAFDLREVLFQGRGWQRYAVNYLRELVQCEGMDFLFVVEDVDKTIESYPFLGCAGVEYIAFELDRNLYSKKQSCDQLEACDIYHSFTEFPEFDVPGTTTIVTVHDTSYRICPGHMDAGFVSVAGAAVNWAIESATGILVFSDWVRHCLEDVAKTEKLEKRSTIRKVTFGLGHLRKPPTAKTIGSAVSDFQDKPFLLYVGGFERDKNVSLIVDTYCGSERLQSRFNLVLVGPNPDKLISDIRGRDGICVEGNVDDSTLVSLYSNAFCLISASLDEGLGVCPLEAVALGTPVVCSRIPVFQETLGDVAVFFDPSSTQSLGAAINLLVDGEADFRSAIQASKPVLETYSWRRCVEETTKFYTEVSGLDFTGSIPRQPF